MKDNVKIQNRECSLFLEAAAAGLTTRTKGGAEGASGADAGGDVG